MGKMIEIPRDIKSQFNSVIRFQYAPYEIDYALRFVESIGKERNPKFSIDEENRFLYENMIRWIHGDQGFMCINPSTKKVIPGDLSTGIYVAGNTGTGKSWALEIMSAYCLFDNVQVFSGGTKRCLHWNCVRADTICDEYVEQGTFDKYKKNPIVCFQDLGSEPLESMYMDNRSNVLNRILEYHGDQTDQITLISSNLPMNNEIIKERYGDRTASRLNQMCNYFELRGKDRRKY